MVHEKDSTISKITEEQSAREKLQMKLKKEVSKLTDMFNKSQKRVHELELQEAELVEKLEVSKVMVWTNNEHIEVELKKANLKGEKLQQRLDDTEMKLSKVLSEKEKVPTAWPLV
eukprot:TRINITY_DN3782_c0_g1_i1.p1 TRINITY_DN3782_c0_g1~~TRINITY_DN3782_c0_g1_i1.p1  ORF type:complete len:115 (+),score=40.99 TRINITY_DN3782_c0_g1_i1:85-429(+)